MMGCVSDSAGCVVACGTEGMLWHADLKGFTVCHIEDQQNTMGPWKQSCEHRPGHEGCASARTCKFVGCAVVAHVLAA